MNIVCQFITENPIHLSMPGYQGQTLKSLTDQDHLKMRLRPGRDIVVATFINDFQVLKIQRLRKFLYYPLLNLIIDSLPSQVLSMDTRQGIL